MKKFLPLRDCLQIHSTRSGNNLSPLKTALRSARAYLSSLQSSDKPSRKKSLFPLVKAICKQSLILFLCSFNRLDYNQITLGTPAQEVVQRYGEPYAVRELGKGIFEYRYIERVSMNRELVYENHYYLRIQDGQVVSKRFREETRQPYDQMYQPDPNYPHYP